NYRDVLAAASSTAERTTALADVLTREGYAASTRSVASGEQLCQHHCPVAHVAADFPQLCEAETAAFAEVLGTHVQRLATIANGDPACTTHVPYAWLARQKRDDNTENDRNSAGSLPKSQRKSPESWRRGALMTAAAEQRTPTTEQLSQEETLAKLGNYKYGWADPDVAGASARRGLDEEVVRDISAKKNEPEWMLENRLKALKLFERKPMPNWGADLSGIDFDSIKYFVRSTEKQAQTWDDLPEDIKRTYD